MGARYVMGDATFAHLTAWCERVTLTPEEADLLRERIIVHLQQLPESEAAWEMDHGWPHIRDLLS